MVNKPNFFIVGAPKCGTTSLYQYLGQHPQIFVSRLKEPTYFGTDLCRPGFIRSRDQYLSLFDAAKSEELIGEASVWYLYSKKAAAEIHSFNRDAKILIMLRNPIDVMYSAHGQQLFNGNETIEDFAEALDAEPQRSKGAKIPAGDFLKEGLLYRDTVRFYEQVSRYLERFDVKIILLDDLKANPLKTYRETTSFLTVDVAFEPKFYVANRARTVRSAKLRDLLRAPPPVLERLSALLVPHWFRWRVTNAIRRVNSRPGSRPPMDPEYREGLKVEFAPQIQRLEDLIGRDLSPWYRA